MQDPVPAAPPSNAISRLLVRFAGTPTHGRARSVAIIVSVLGVIGWIDYLAGTHVSLELFYLVPVTLSVAWLGWRAGCAAAVLSLMIRVAGDLAAGPYQFPAAAFWNRLMDFSIYLVVVGVTNAFIRLQRELEQRVRQRTALLEQANTTRNELQQQLFEISRRERSAIGHDLHDGLGQHLTATSIAADLLASRLAAAGHPATDNARKVVTLLQEAIAKTRQVARGLLLSAVEPAGLASELEELAETIRKEHAVRCTFTLRGAVDGIDGATASHLFYIAQEAARNSVRHARASRIYINLAMDDRALTLSITDNGRGPPPEGEDSGGMGVPIMRHRTTLIGGEFTLGPAPGCGTLVRCRVSLGSGAPDSGQ